MCLSSISVHILKERYTNKRDSATLLLSVCRYRSLGRLRIFSSRVNNSVMCHQHQALTEARRLSRFLHKTDRRQVEVFRGKNTLKPAL